LLLLCAKIVKEHPPEAGSLARHTRTLFVSTRQEIQDKEGIDPKQGENELDGDANIIFDGVHQYQYYEHHDGADNKVGTLCADP
jgi:hypothetical protein